MGASHAGRGRMTRAVAATVEFAVSRLRLHRIEAACIPENAPSIALLERNGFRFVRHDTKVADFYDEDEIRRVYYPEMETLIKAQSGAKRVVVFDHTLRTADDELREAKKIREVVRRVHNDYTEWSGPQRVRDLLPDEAETLLKNRLAIIQVWRAINTPIERNPLAIVDARTLAPADLVPAERRFHR